MAGLLTTGLTRALRRSLGRELYIEVHILPVYVSGTQKAKLEYIMVEKDNSADESRAKAAARPRKRTKR